MDWQPIETAPEGERLLIWCADSSEHHKFGTVRRYSDGDLHVNAEGMSGNWNYTHYQLLPEAPDA